MSDAPGGADEVEVEAEPLVPEGDGAGDLPPRGCLGTATAVAGALLGVTYLLNPGAGMIEILPDVVPVVGNLDEAGATALVIFALRYLFVRRR